LAGIRLFKKYVEKKAKNFATKQDVEQITRKVESVKAEISREQAILDAKYKLKHQACIEALTLIDAIFSHQIKNPGIAKQYMTTEQARQCHSKLILACENPAIANRFNEIVVNLQKEHTSSEAPTDLLNEFRNLIRRELGFGEELVPDRETAWIGNVVCDKEESAAKQQMELAEDVLGLFYDVRDAIAAIRGGLDSDAKQSLVGLVDTVEQRLKQRTETFNRLKSMRTRFVVQFGPDEVEPFEEIRQVLIDIQDAVARLKEFEVAHGRAYDDETSERLIETMKEYEAILACSYDGEDEIDEQVERAVSQMEKTCNRIIMRK